MRNPVIKISAFLLALAIGLNVGWFLRSAVLPPTSEIGFVPMNDSIESMPKKVADKTTKPAVSKVKPCGAEDDFRWDERWRGRGIIQGGVLNGRIECGILPEYSQPVKDKNISGWVTVNIVVDYDGKVISAKAGKGHPLLMESAIKAACQTRFSPTLLGGENYKVKGVLMYKFDSESGTNLQSPSSPDNPFRVVKRYNY